MRTRRARPPEQKMWGHWKFLKLAEPRDNYRTYWHVLCTKCNTEYIRTRVSIVHATSTQCMSCKNREMPHTKARYWDWRAIKYRRSIGQTWEKIAKECGSGCTPSALIQAAKCRGIESGDYGRALKNKEYFYRVRILSKIKTWEEVYKILPQKYKNYGQLRDAYYKELYKVSFKKAMKFLDDGRLYTDCLTQSGYSAAQIAKVLGVGERTVTRYRKQGFPVSWHNLCKLYRDITEAQFSENITSEITQDLCVLSNSREMHNQEILAWSDAIVSIKNSLDEFVLDAEKPWSEINTDG